MYKDPDAGARFVLILVVLTAIVLVGGLAMAFIPSFALAMLFVCAVATSGTLIFFKLFE